MIPLNRRTLLKGGTLGALAASVSRATVAEAPPVQSGGRRIKIGQIGVGHAHASKLAVYRGSPDYEVVGIVEPDEAARKRAQAQDPFRDLPWMTQEQLLNHPGLEAVLVETHVRESLNVAEACLAADKHIHLDKPAGQSLPQFRRLLATAASKNRLVQMGYMYRYNPAVVLMRQMLSQGWLGEPYEVHAVMSKVVEPAERERLAEFSGGMMFELGCHIIDLVVGILGKPSVVTPFPQHAAKAGDRLNDNMLAVFQYPKALATVKSSAMEVDGGARRHLVVCGTEGTFHIQPLDNPAARVALSTPRDGYKRGYQEVTFPRYQRYIADALDMARILRGEKSSDFSLTHDGDVQETVLRASDMRIDT